MEAPLRILVAEDDADDALLLCRALAHAGVTAPVVVVRDGQEVLDYLEAKPPFHDLTNHFSPNLLLLDLKMPRLNGFEVLEWLKSRGLLEGLVVVVLSSSADPDDLRRACALGARFYVVKPTAFEELAHVVERVHDYWRDTFAKTQGRPLSSA